MSDLREAQDLVARACKALAAASTDQHPALATYRDAIADAHADAVQLGRRVATLRRMLNFAAETGPTRAARSPQQRIPSTRGKR